MRLNAFSICASVVYLCCIGGGFVFVYLSASGVYSLIAYAWTEGKRGKG